VETTFLFSFASFILPLACAIPPPQESGFLFYKLGEALQALGK